MRAAVVKAGRGIRWYLRQATGEAKWYEYVDRCRSQGVVPMSRREFERHRAEHGSTTRSPGAADRADMRCGPPSPGRRTGCQRLPLSSGGGGGI